MFSHRTSMLDGLGDGAQTATPAGIGLFTPTFAGLYPLRDDSLNVRVPVTTDVITYRLTVVAEAITQRDWVFGLLDAHAR